MPARAWSRFLTPALTALGLLACQPDDSAGPAKTVSGAARIAVRALPDGYLPAGSRAILFLDVTGPGMAPIHSSAPLPAGQSIVIGFSDIPAGKERVFHGLLVRVDSVSGDTVATHEGSDTVSITAGPATDVHLYLKSLGAGAARVCLDVEGWPANPACDSVVPPVTNVNFDSVECWKVSQTTVDGRFMTGDLWVGWKAAFLIGWFQWDWNNAAFAVTNGTVPASGGTLYLYGTLPGGFGHPMRNAIENAHYKAKISPSGLDFGAAYARIGVTEFTSDDKFADWEEVRTPVPRRPGRSWRPSSSPDPNRGPCGGGTSCARKSSNRGKKDPR
jgi:hypothetical protein